MPDSNIINMSKKSTVIMGCLIISFVMGSIHAFSLFLEPIETKFNVSRTYSSLTYSISLLSITTAVYFGDYIYNYFRPTRIVFLVLVLSTLGTLMSAYSESIFFVWIGFGLFFGFANGIGYGFTLQYSALVRPNSKALMMGLVTSSYGLGATIFPIFFKETILFRGFENSMISLTKVFFITFFFVFFLFKFSNLEFNPKKVKDNIRNSHKINKYLLWIIYGCSISSGLMCFSHALGIAKSFFVTIDYIYKIPIFMGLLNMVGGILFSSIIKKFAYLKIIMFLSISTVCSLLIFFFIPSKTSVLICLFMVSFSYGGVISIFPSMINRIYGVNLGIKIYGFVFTAWGLFGFLMPFLAGWTFEIFESYSFIIFLSSILGIIPLIMIKLKRQNYFL